jgi:hypothetical protein
MILDPLGMSKTFFFSRRDDTALQRDTRPSIGPPKSRGPGPSGGRDIRWAVLSAP